MKVNNLINWIVKSKHFMHKFDLFQSVERNMHCMLEHLGHWNMDKQGGSRTTSLACFRDHILFQSL